MQTSELMQRLRWQCRRGMLELDCIFSVYLDVQFASAPEEEQQQFVRLLQQQDTDLYQWLLDDGIPDAEFERIVRRLRPVI